MRARIHTQCASAESRAAALQGEELSWGTANAFSNRALQLWVSLQGTANVELLAAEKFSESGGAASHRRLERDVCVYV